MKLRANIAGHQASVEIQDGGVRVLAEIDGRHYELEVHDSADGYLLRHNGRLFNCRVEGRPEAGQPLDVIVGTTHYPVTISDLKRLRNAASAGAHGDQAARIVAPMPGKVVRVLVNVGDQIETGAGIVVVEAMKMQNEMKSPRAGTVVTLNAQIGSTVNGGDVLAVIE